SKLFAEGLGQSCFANQRHEPGSNCFPKGAFDERLQPPMPPVLQRASIDAQALAENLDPLGFEPMLHGRNQNHDDPHVDLTSQETDRRWGVSLAASVPITAKTVTINFLTLGRSTPRLPLVVGPVQMSRQAEEAPNLLDFCGQVG